MENRALLTAAVVGGQDSPPASAALLLSDPSPAPKVGATVEVSRPSPGPVDAVISPIRAVVLGVLGVFGFNPDPSAPSGNPVLDAIWGLYRRVESLFANEAPTAADPTITSALVDGKLVVTGNLNAADSDFDHLTYTVTGSQSVSGDVQIDSATGNFTFTMADAAQAATFTVAISDGTSSFLGASNTSTATYTVTVLDRAPVISEHTGPGAPDQNGTVTGSFLVSDPDGQVTYVGVSTSPGSGSVRIALGDPLPTGVAGEYRVTYTYTPSPVARTQAYSATGPADDHFVVSVTDGQLTSRLTVTVTIDPAQKLRVVPPEGESVSRLVFNPRTGTAYQLSTLREGDTVSTQVTVIRPDGTTFRPDRLAGAADRQPVVVDATSGVAYVTTSVSNADTGTSVTYVTTIRPDGTAVTTGALPGQPSAVATTAAMTARPTSALVVNPVSGAAYLATGGIVDGVTTGWITIIHPDGSVLTTDPLPGAALAVLVNPKSGTTFVFSRSAPSTELQAAKAAAVATVRMAVTAILPDDTVLDAVDLPGSPVALTFDQESGLGYLASAILTRTGDSTTRVTLLAPDGTLTLTGDLPGVPPTDRLGSVSGPTVLAVDPSSGVAYLTTTRATDVIDVFSTWVSVINPDGTTSTTSPQIGTPAGSLAIDPVTGVAYQGVSKVVSEVLADGTVSTTTVTRVMVVSADGTATATEPVTGDFRGLAVNPVSGDAYLVTAKGTPDGPSTTVSVVHADGTADVSSSVVGTTSSDLTIDPQSGRAYFLVTRNVDGNDVVRVAVVLPDGTARTSDDALNGRPGRIVIDSAHGVAYVTTKSFDSGTSVGRLTVVHADGTSSATTLPGTPYSDVAVDAATGRAFIVTTGNDGGAGHAWVSFINPDDTNHPIVTSRALIGSVVGSGGGIEAKLAAIEAASTVDYGATIDPKSGTVYVTTREFDFASGTWMTHDYAVRPDGTTLAIEPLAGSPAGPVSLDPVTGVVFQTIDDGSTWIVAFAPPVPAQV